MSRLLDELSRRSILILGLGVEGRNTLRFLRTRFPRKFLAVADGHPFGALGIESQTLIQNDPYLRVHLGTDYLSYIGNYDVVFRTPGIPLRIAGNTQRNQRAQIWSETSLFFALRKNPVVGVTGTKGKSTTSTLIHTMLTEHGIDSHLVGNIGPELGGSSPLASLDSVKHGSVFVYELSSFQLEDMHESPDIAVLLNIVPEHLDHHLTFDQYVGAKERITKYQSSSNFLVYNHGDKIVRRIARRTSAKPIPISLDRRQSSRCFAFRDRIVYGIGAEKETVATTADVQQVLPGKFNHINVMAAISVAKLLDVPTDNIRSALRSFVSLKDRFEFVGEYKGISFYNAAIATVPQATIAHIQALSPDVDTLILGGQNRGVDYTSLARSIVRARIHNLILFPETGSIIWRSVLTVSETTKAVPNHFFVDDMEQAVRIAFEKTRMGYICLHSPAAPSRGGTFENYLERGNLFRQLLYRFGSC